MSFFAAYAQLAGYAVATLFTPGPNNTMLAASGAQFGFSRTRWHLLGVALGFPLMLFPVALGLGEVMARAPWLHQVLRFIGAGLLLYMSWRIATAGAAKPGEARARPLNFFEAAAFQWVNPKAWTMALGVAASHMAGRAGGTLREALICALIFAALGICSAAVWTGFGAALRLWLTNDLRRRVFNGAMGALLAGFVVYDFIAGA